MQSSNSVVSERHSGLDHKDDVMNDIKPEIHNTDDIKRSIHVHPYLFSQSEARVGSGPTLL